MEEIAWIPEYVFEDSGIYRAMKQGLVFMSHTFKCAYLTRPRAVGTEPIMGFYYRVINGFRILLVQFVNDFLAKEKQLFLDQIRAERSKKEESPSVHQKTKK